MNVCVCVDVSVYVCFMTCIYAYNRCVTLCTYVCMHCKKAFVILTIAIVTRIATVD